MLASFLIPSRNRIEKLIRSIVTILETTSNADQLEILLRIDFDDQATISSLSSLPLRPNDKVIIGHRGRGWTDTYKYYNELASLATGAYLVVWNDDARIVSHNWDSSMIDRAKRGQHYLRMFDSSHKPYYWFPIISKEYYKIIGHMSLNAHLDNWLMDLSNPFSLIVDYPEFRIEHDNAFFTGNSGHVDQTWQEGSIHQYQHAVYDGEEMKRARAVDIEKIRHWLFSKKSKNKICDCQELPKELKNVRIL